LPLQKDEYARSPEAILAGLARNGDRDAFAELVNRRQAWIRNLMRRCCNDAALADDLAQQVFMQAWKNIPQLQRVSRFGAWLAHGHQCLAATSAQERSAEKCRGG